MPNSNPKSSKEYVKYRTASYEAFINAPKAIEGRIVAHLHNTTFMGTELKIQGIHFRIHEHTPQGYRLQNLSSKKESFVTLDKLLIFVGKNEF